MNLRVDINYAKVGRHSKTDRLVGFGFQHNSAIQPTSIKEFPGTVFYQNDANPSALKGRNHRVFGLSVSQGHALGAETSATADTKLIIVCDP